MNVMIKETPIRPERKHKSHVFYVKDTGYATDENPEAGPKILFFSGGTALKKLSCELIRYTHNSSHIITPFDSGGSSAKLRNCFEIPAVGDIRSRLISLSDRSIPGMPETLTLMAHRLSSTSSNKDLRYELNQIVRGAHPLTQNIPSIKKTTILNYLQTMEELLPPQFCLKNASIGNLALAATYIENGRNFETMISSFSKLLAVRGTICPPVNLDLHLTAKYDNGTILTGQHLITGKEVEPIRSKINRLFLSKSLKDPRPVRVSASYQVLKQISEADLICYPVGSFYSSIIATLLPEKIGHAISKAKCPKVYVPNTGNMDPEAYGMDLKNHIDILKRHLNNKNEPNRGITHILLDENEGLYKGDVTPGYLQKNGIDKMETQLVSKSSFPFIDENLLIKNLLALVK